MEIASEFFSPKSNSAFLTFKNSMSTLTKGLLMKTFMIAPLHLCQLVSLHRIYFEFSCTNCLMNQKQLHRLSNLLLSCKCNEVDPNAPSPSKTQVKLEGSAVAVVTEDEGVPHTSESNTSSDSFSGDAIIFILGQNNKILFCLTNRKVRLLPLLLQL